MRSLRCEELVELVTSSLDGALGPETESGFAEHLAGCQGCGRYLDQMRWVIQSLRANGGNASPTTT